MSNLPRLLQKSYEWHTPTKIITLVRKVLGVIDLDPASCEQADKIVQASQYYDIATDGLTQPWFGHVWLNPPYCKSAGVSNQELWTRKLIAEYEGGNVEEALLLVNAATETRWFQRLYVYPICFVRGRIRFLNPTGITTGPTVGSAVIYFGSNLTLFTDVFSQLGVIVNNVTPLQRKYTTLNLWTHDGGVA